MNPSTASFEELVAGCRHERASHRRTGVASSPCCIELFRRLIDYPDRTMSHLQDIFRPLLHAWVGAASGIEDRDEVIHLAWIAFWQAVQPPSDILVRDDHLGRVLVYLRTCTITALLQIQRARRRRVATESLQDAPNTRWLPTKRLADPRDMAAEVAERVTIQALVARHLHTPEERMAVHLRFTLGWPPRTILAHYPHIFPDPTSLRILIQRVMRRLQQDNDLRCLCDTPSCHITSAPYVSLHYNGDHHKTGASPF